MIIRMSAGDLNAWVALIGFILGVLIPRAGVFTSEEQYQWSGKYACSDPTFSGRRADLRGSGAEIQDVFCGKHPRCDPDEKL